MLPASDYSPSPLDTCITPTLINTHTRREGVTTVHVGGRRFPELKVSRARRPEMVSSSGTCVR